jgi:phage I-like protein
MRTKRSKRHARIADGRPCSFDFGVEGQTNIAWHQLAVEGKWDGHWMGPFSLDEPILRQMEQANAAKRIETVVDYEHASVFSDRAPAAGWIKSLEVRKPEGGSNELWGQVEWTQAAADHIRAKEYRYLSPTIIFNTRDRKSGAMSGASLHSVALTNKPFLEELPEVRLNSENLAALFGAPSAEEDDPMNEAQFRAMCRALGLSETSPYDDVIVACGKAAASMSNLSELCAALGLQPSASITEAKASILKLQNPADRVSAAEFAALKTQLAERDARDAVRAAMSEGKVTAEGTPLHSWALKAAKESPAMFAEWVASAPKQVSLSVVPAPEHKAPTAADLTPEELTACRAAGITPEDFLKHNALAAVRS